MRGKNTLRPALLQPAKATATSPTTKAAKAPARIIFIFPQNGCINRYLVAWPHAATNAHTIYVRRGVWLMLEKPIAAIAANKASSRKLLHSIICICNYILNAYFTIDIPINPNPRHIPAERDAVRARASGNLLNEQR